MTTARSRFALALITLGLAAPFTMPLAGCAGTRAGPGVATQLSFDSAADAAAALVNGIESSDTPYLRKVFGPEFDRLSSGDAAQDQRERIFFGDALLQATALRDRPEGGYTLLAGERQIEFPVPIIQDRGRWRFDSVAGVENLTNMRIGNNELLTITFLRALPEAQREFFSQDRNADGVLEYAKFLRSTPGHRDGLFWEVEANEVPSPLGPEAAKGDFDSHEPNGYNGYRFGLLTGQGPGAAGGARSFLDAQGRLTGGAGVVAFPAIYGETGIMTFIMTLDGIVYQSDLGADTDAIARAMTTFDPAGWDRVQP